MLADWLQYYNNLDVAPGLEMLDRMKGSTQRRGSIERGAELYTPEKEAYKMLKDAVVEGQRIVIVLTRHHESGVTKIRSHQYEEESRPCRRIFGYDANALYLSTMLRDMPCRKEKVTFYLYPQDEAHLQRFTRSIKKGSWFGFAEVDIKIPEALWPTFEELCPFLYNKEVPLEAVRQKMLKYLEHTIRKRDGGEKIVGALSAEKLLLYAPLLRWYIEHGAVIKAVYRSIDYQPTKIFTWFVEQVKETHRTGDVEKSKALLADVFKLLGNSAYGKLIEALAEAD